MTNRKVEEILNHVGDLCTGKEANDVMNEYFINIGKELASKLPDSHFDYNINGVCNLQLSVFNEFTNEILFKILKETSLTKSSGLDEISTRLLVDAFYAIPDILVKFFNFSLKNGQIPQCFKIAKVTPLPKKGNITLLNNLRPISSTPFPSKILEKHVSNNICSYMESNNLFLKNQNGFRKGKSTIQAVNNIVNKLYEHRNNGEYSILIFLDLSKAFNCVNHDILRTKLGKLGITGQCGQWLIEYLRDRKQFVQNCGIKSDCKIINYGIPQGTVLGPLMYLLYVNDIMDSNLISDLNMFADDTAIVAHGSVLTDVVAQITGDIEKLGDWLNYNKLTVNLDKTKCMYFGKGLYEENHMLEVNVNGVKLEFVKSFSYLGITIDTKLQFNEHIKNATRNAGHKVYMLSRIRHCINKKTALAIFKSMILPYLEYGNIFYGTCSEFNKYKLQVIQNNGLKIALNRNVLYNTVDLHIEAKLLPCKYRRLIMLQKNTFRELQGNLAKINRRDVCTRAHDATLIHVTRPKSELYKKSNCYNGAIIWNNLPVYIRSLREINEFKSEIRRYYFGMFLSDNDRE